MVMTGLMAMGVSPALGATGTHESQGEQNPVQRVTTPWGRWERSQPRGLAQRRHAWEGSPQPRCISKEPQAEATSCSVCDTPSHPSGAGWRAAVQEATAL